MSREAGGVCGTMLESSYKLLWWSTCNQCWSNLVNSRSTLHKTYQFLNDVSLWSCCCHLLSPLNLISVRFKNSCGRET
uniref:Putative ovule protein n=1 Tax=Solanum chacoense TaxID=4108 RepID=A0A0V0HVK3_SOLCH